MNLCAKTEPKFEAVTPRLPVSDVEEALAFYLDQLGFQLGWKWGNPLTHANVCRDSISVDCLQARQNAGERLWPISSLAALTRTFPN